MIPAAWVGAAATTALRRSSADDLASGTARYLQLCARSRLWRTDPDEALAGLAPFLDCARSLAVDPVALIGEAARPVEPELAELATSFVREHDTSLAANGWRIEQTPAGPEYVRAVAGRI